MTDRYQSLAHNPIGKFVVKNLGLPNPPVLERWTEGTPLVRGTVLHRRRSRQHAGQHAQRDAEVQRHPGGRRAR